MADCIASGSGSLSRLLLEKNGITSAGAKDLAAALRKTSHVRWINLNNNGEIGADGAVALLNVLAEAGRCRVERVEFDGCGMGDKGAEAVGGVILSGGGSTRISVERNDIHAAGFRAIAEAVANAPIGAKIGMLNLRANQAGKEGVEAVLEKIIRPARVVQELDIRRVGLGPDGVKAVVAALRIREKGVLERVNVGEYDYGEEGLRVLTEFIGEECRAVHKMVLNYS